MTTTEQINAYIKNTSDWRGERLRSLRKLIHEASPEIVEEWKWGVPIFIHKTMVCAISVF